MYAAQSKVLIKLTDQCRLVSQNRSVLRERFTEDRAGNFKPQFETKLRAPGRT